LSERTLIAALLLLAACAGEPDAGDAGDAGDTIDAVRGRASEGLVFVRVVEGSLDLARARLADSAVRAFSETPNHDETWPYWSQPSRQLVVQRSAGRGGRTPSDLNLWDAETNARRALTQTPRRQERWPAWAPNGRSLVYAFRGGHPAAGVALLDPDAPDAPQRLLAQSTGTHYFLRPSFAPDGVSVVAQRRGADAASSKLWLLAEGAEPLALTSEPAWTDLKAHFSRDGARVFYTRRPASGGPHDIASVDLTGGDPRLHASRPDADDHSARPSPTRDEFVFVSDRSGNSDVYLADFAGGPPRNLTRSADRDEYAPRWSPDGDFVVMTRVAADDKAPQLSDRDSLARAHLLVLDREGRVHFETAGLMPDWMPAW